MLIRISKKSIMNILTQAVKLPLSANILHKINHMFKGNYIVYFHMHRVLADHSHSHPHYLNGSAITLKQALKELKNIHSIMPFISLSDSLSFLTGQKNLTHARAVLLIDTPYFLTMDLLMPYLVDMNIPLTIAIDSDNLSHNTMPWMDEISFRLGYSAKTTLSMSFLDRQYRLNTINDKISTMNNIIDYLRLLPIDIFLWRLKEIRDYFSDISLLNSNERMLTIDEIKSMGKKVPLSLCYAGKRLSLSMMSQAEIYQEIIAGFNDIKNIFKENILPIYFSHFYYDDKQQKNINDIMMINNFLGAIYPHQGLHKPGDNMFSLSRLPLSQQHNTIAKLEIMIASNLIDQLITLGIAKEKD